MVDVVTRIVIDRPTAQVAEYARDPANATHWYQNIVSSTLVTPPPLRVGSEIAFVAHFLGRRLEYTYEVAEVADDRRFVMRTSDGPFAMETIYEWEPVTEGTTRMTLRNRGDPSGFSAIIAPFMSIAMRRANRNDLRRIKQLLERQR